MLRRRQGCLEASSGSGSCSADSSQAKPDQAGLASCAPKTAPHPPGPGGLTPTHGDVSAPGSRQPPPDRGGVCCKKPDAEEQAALEVFRLAELQGETQRDSEAGVVVHLELRAQPTA
ncbi:uncharacterized protein LOC143644315 [Tamandua tetradactyla]|uniref:uncharacterized protein LOC143644315 n=1 Tax=Tamandua tetradactyla TaxID=48850 RepID=UPI0040542226